MVGQLREIALVVVRRVLRQLRPQVLVVTELREQHSVSAAAAGVQVALHLA